MQGSHDMVAADRLLGAAIEQHSRTDARDAIVGPIVQLMTGHADRVAIEPGVDVENLAEAALAAALALIARDIIPREAFEALYHPFEALMPLRETAGN
jgi:hypothetical protein